MPHSHRAIALVALGALIAWGGACGHGKGVGEGWPNFSQSDLAREASLREEMRRDGLSTSRLAELAALRLAAKDPNSAQNYALKALAISENDVPSLVFLARAERALGDLRASAGRYARVARIRPTALEAIRSEWKGVLYDLAAQWARRKNEVQLKLTLDQLAQAHFSHTQRERAELRLHRLALVRIHLGKKDLKKATEALAVARSAGAQSSRTDFLEAQLLAQSGKLQESKEAFATWAERGGGVDRFSRVAAFYRAHFRLKEALWAYRAGLERRPSSSKLWREMATLLVLVREPANSYKAWIKAADLASKSAEKSPLEKHEILVAGAEELRRAGYRPQALSLFREAVARAPTDPGVLEGYGEYLAQLGMGQELVTTLRSYVRSLVRTTARFDQRSTILGQITRAIDLLEQAGRLQAAVDLMQEVLNANPDSLTTCLKLAGLQHRQANPASRNATMAKCRHLAGKDPAKLGSLTRAWLEFESYREATKTATEIRSIDPASVEAVLVHARVEASRGADETARKLLTSFYEQGGKQPAHALAIAQHYMEIGRWKAAREFLAPALPRARAETEARFHRALVRIYLSAAEKHPGKASFHLRRWLVLSPPSRQHEVLKPLVMRTLGDPQLGTVRLLVLERLAQLQPENDLLKMQLGKLKMRQRDYEGSHRMFEALFDKNGYDPAMVEPIAREFADAGQDEVAFQILSRLHPVQLRSSSLVVYLGELYDDRAKRHEALSCYQEFLQRAQKGEVEAERLGSFARSMLTSRRFKLATGAFKLLRKRSTHKAEALSGLAETRLRQGRMKEARRLFELYIAAHKGRAITSALGKVADLYVQRGETREATRLLEEQLSQERQRWEAPSFTKLCALYRKLGDRDGLVRASEILLNRGFNQARAAELAAKELAKAGLVGHAFKILERTYQQSPRHLRKTNTLLRALIRYAALTSDRPKMLKYARAYATNRGKQHVAWIEAAAFLAEQNEDGLALELLTEALKEAPSDAMLLVARGGHFVTLGRIRQAESDFAAALTQTMSVGVVMKDVRSICRRASQPRLLANVENLARAFHPGRTESYLALGTILLENGDLEGARRSFARYLEKNARGHAKVARAYGPDHIEEALRHYEKAGLKNNDQAMLIISEVANLLAIYGDPDRMDLFAQRFVLQARDPQAGFEAMSSAWRKVGRPEKAIRWRELALQHRPSASSQLQLAKDYFAIGNTAKARKAFVDYIKFETSGDFRNRRHSLRQSHATVTAFLKVMVFYFERHALSDALHVVSQLESTGRTPITTVARTEALLRSGDVLGALELAETQRLLLAKASVGDLERLVRLLGRSGHLSEALRFLSIANKTKIGGSLGRLRLVYLARLGRISELEREVARQIGQGSEAIAVDLGVLLFEEGQPGLAQRLLKRYLATGAVLRRSEARVALSRAKRATGSTDHDQGKTSPTFAPSVPSTFERASEQASFHYQLGEYGPALAAATEALSFEPGNALLRRIHLVSSLIRGDQSVAIGQIRRALLTDMNEPGGESKLLARIRQMAAPKIEVMALELLLERKSKKRPIHLELVEAALRAGNAKKAQYHAEQFLVLSNEDSQAVQRLVDLFVRMGALDRAERLLDRAAETGGGPREKRRLVRLEIALMRGVQSAILNQASAILASPRANRKLRLDAARANEDMLGPPELTQRFVGDELDLANASRLALELSARGWWRAGDPLRAQAALGQLLKRFPAPTHASIHSYKSLMRACLWAGDTKGLHTLSEHIVRHTSNGRLTVSTLVSALLHEAPRGAKVLKSEVALEAAAAIIQRASTHGDASESATSSWSYLEEARNNKEAARKTHRLTVDQNGPTPTNLNNLAYVYARHGVRLDEALRLVRRARKKSLVNQASYVDTEAWILFKLGHVQAALKLMREAFYLGAARSRGTSLEPEMLYHYGEILRANGLRDAANARFRQCAPAAPNARYGRLCVSRLKPSEGPRP